MRMVASSALGSRISAPPVLSPSARKERPAARLGGDVAVLVDDKVEQRLAGDSDHGCARGLARKAFARYRVEGEDVIWLDVESDLLSRGRRLAPFGACHHRVPVFG